MSRPVLFVFVGGIHEHPFDSRYGGTNARRMAENPPPDLGGYGKGGESD